jgi:hypothetical protein
MKTAKLGTIFLVAVMTLAGVGASYAHWFDGVTVQVKADMAWFGIGFVDQATNDPISEWNEHLEDTYYDPIGNQGSYQSHNDPDQPEGRPRECGESLPPHPTRPKDYAWTRCWLRAPRFWHDGTEMFHLDERCYEIIEVELGNVYPNYAPNLYFDIANAGTLAADIVGHWLIEGPPGVDPQDETTWIFMEKCTMYSFDIGGPMDVPDGLLDIEIGFFMDPQYVPPNPDQPQQIDPCQTIMFGLSFHILQPYPQCTTTTFKFKIRALNYNHEVCDLDDPQPPIDV